VRLLRVVLLLHVLAQQTQGIFQVWVHILLVWLPTRVEQHRRVLLGRNRLLLPRKQGLVEIVGWLIIFRCQFATKHIGLNELMRFGHKFEVPFLMCLGLVACHVYCV
jgi:hypothetical protein